MKNALPLLTGLLLLAVGTLGTHGAVFTFSDQATFLDFTENGVVEDFESYSDTGEVSLISTTYFDLSTSPDDGGTSFLDLGDKFPGVLPTSGSKVVAAGSNTLSPFTLSFDLAAPASAIGFHVADFGDGGAGTLSFLSDFGESYEIASSSLPNNNALFFGIVDTTREYSTFMLVKTTTVDGFGLDDVHLGDAIPESSRALLSLAGLGAMLVRRRR